MKRTLLISLLLLAAALSPIHATEITSDWQRAEQALIAKQWATADLLLDAVAKQRNLTAAHRFNLALNQAWVALQLGQKQLASNHLRVAYNLSYQPSELEQMALEDTRLAILLADVKGLPPMDERIVYSGTPSKQTQFFNTLEQMQEWIGSRLNHYLEPRSYNTPFAKPVAPILTRGEFEKPSAFLQRVETAQTEYLKRIESYHQRTVEQQQSVEREQQAKMTYLPTLRRLYTQIALGHFLGSSQFQLHTYEAEPEFFPATISLQGAATTATDYPIILDEPIGPAKSLKPALQQAQPLLVYRLSNNILTLTHFLLQLPNQEVRVARLDNRTGRETTLTQYQVPEVSLPTQQLSSNSSTLSQIMGATEMLALNIDPEIRKLKQQLVTAQSGANQQRIVTLQQEIAQLEQRWQKSFDDDLPKLLAHTTPVAENPHHYALIIGIGQYAQTHNVEFADRSAKLFAQIAQRLLGVPSDHLITLYNEEATGSTIKTRIRFLGEQLTSKDKLFFYYAGHGIPNQDEEGEPYLLPYDLDPGFASHEEDMRLANIWQSLTKNHQGHVVAFLDSCFSGNTDNRMVFKGVAPGIFRRKAASIPAGKQLTIFAAGSQTQFANYYPEKGHRLFSYYLMEGLIKGYRTPQQLHGYLTNKVEKKSLRQGPSYRQQPQLQGYLPASPLS